MKASELNWFRPLWKRLTVVIFLSIWLVWELFGTQDQFWAAMVGIVLAYSVYNFFYAFPKEAPKSEVQNDSADDESDAVEMIEENERKEP